MTTLPASQEGNPSAYASAMHTCSACISNYPDHGKTSECSETPDNRPCGFSLLGLAFSLSPLPEIQLSAKDFENEKIDRQNMQHQLHKVLKELRKARDQISKLESVSVSADHNHMYTHWLLLRSLSRTPHTSS